MATVHYLYGQLEGNISDPWEFFGPRPYVFNRSETHFTDGISTTVSVVGQDFTYGWNDEPTSGIVHSVEVQGFAGPYVTIEGLESPWLNVARSGYEVGGITFDGLKGQLISWLSGNDDVHGTSGNNVLRGYEGANRYYGNGGNDIIDGIYGFDTVVFEGARSQFSFSGGKVRDQGISRDAIIASNGQTSALMVDVERVEFEDWNVAIDLTGNGNSGWAARLIGSLVGEQALSDKALAGEVISYVDTYGIQTVAELLVDLGVTAALAGGADNASFFTLLYKNVVGSPPPAAEIAELVDYVDSGAFTQAQALQVIAGLDLTANQIGLTGLAQTGWDYVEFGG